MARVEMTSPATSGTAMVPEKHVKAYEANGWQLTKAKSEPKPSPGKGSSKKSSK